MGVFQDLTGQRFERLVVISRTTNSRTNMTRWLCKCDCGKEKIVHSAHLKSGASKSCGCLQKELARSANLIHGHSNKNITKEYRAWKHIRKRCYSVNCKDYKDYGGRGIRVCERWLESFQNFLNDMGNAPSKDLSIDRIDNDGDYEPNNCRWATTIEQAGNKRKSIIYQDICLKEYCRQNNLNYGAIYQRIKKCNWSIKEAISTPIQKRK